MPLDYTALMTAVIPEMHQTYTAKDTILYALGLGVGADDPFDAHELRYLYEDVLQALPTQAVTLGFNPIWLANPAFRISYTQILHLAQSLTMHKPLPPAGTVTSELVIDGILDKGAKRGAVLCLTRKLRESASKALLATIGHTLFLRADGGFGGSDGAPPAPHSVPTQRSPDAVYPLPNRANQALIYRLSGDTNPLHIDPAVALKSGFDKPILHGLCAYGMAGRALIRHLCQDDPTRVCRLDVQFTNPAFPGEPLELHLWKQEPGQAAFRLLAPARDVVVEDHGRFDFEP